MHGAASCQRGEFHDEGDASVRRTCSSIQQGPATARAHIHGHYTQGTQLTRVRRWSLACYIWQTPARNAAKSVEGAFESRAWPCMRKYWTRRPSMTLAIAAGYHSIRAGDSVRRRPGQLRAAGPSPSVATASEQITRADFEFLGGECGFVWEAALELIWVQRGLHGS